MQARQKLLTGSWSVFANLVTLGARPQPGQIWIDKSSPHICINNFYKLRFLCIIKTQ